MQASSNTNTNMNITNNKNNSVVYIKVTAGQENRMVGIPADATFAELEEQVSKSFGMAAQLDMRYVDEEQDKVCVSSDEELRYALDFFAGRTMRLYLTFKGTEESAKTTIGNDQKTCPCDIADEKNDSIQLQKLKEKLDEAGFDVPQWRCRKLMAKFDGNVDQAVEAVRQRRERKAHKMHACGEGPQILPPPPGFPPMPVGHRHGPHHFGGHHHGPHHFKDHHHKRQGDEGFEPHFLKCKKFAHHHGPEHAFAARGCFRGSHPHHAHPHHDGPHAHPRGFPQHGLHHRGCHPMPGCPMPPVMPHGGFPRHGLHHRGCHPRPRSTMPPMMPHGGFPPHAHCRRRFHHGPMFA